MVVADDAEADPEGQSEAVPEAAVLDTHSIMFFLAVSIRGGGQDQAMIGELERVGR